MAITEFVRRKCPIDNCTGEVVEVIDDKEIWAIYCPVCKTKYMITHSEDE